MKSWQSLTRRLLSAGLSFFIACPYIKELINSRKPPSTTPHGPVGVDFRLIKDFRGEDKVISPNSILLTQHFKFSFKSAKKRIKSLSQAQIV